MKKTNPGSERVMWLKKGGLFLTGIHCLVFFFNFLENRKEQSCGCFPSFFSCCQKLLVVSSGNFVCTWRKELMVLF